MVERAAKGLRNELWVYADPPALGARPIIEGNTVTGGQSGFVLTSVKPELTGNTVEGVTGAAVSITGSAAPILRDNTLCAEGEVLEIAETAAPDIDDSNEICD